MSTEPTPAVQRATRAVSETAYGVGVEMADREIAVDALDAALDRDCHEAVVPDWADGDEMPCNAYAVAYRQEIVGDAVIGVYPVCEEHARPPLAPLRAALLGKEAKTDG